MKKSGMFENEGRVRLLRIGVLLFLILTAVLAVLSVRLFPDGLLVRLLHMTHATGETPAMYGPFHIGFFVLNFLLVVLITRFGRKIPKSSLDGIVFSAGVPLVSSGTSALPNGHV